MANIYFISDAYFKEQYPAHGDLDMGKFYSTLLIEQNTTLEDIIGEDLLKYLYDNAQSGFSGDYQKLFNDVQYLLVFLVARQLTALNTRSQDTDQRKEVVWDSLNGKISYLKSIIKKLISLSDELSNASGDTFSSAPGNEFPIYFPR